MLIIKIVHHNTKGILCPSQVTSGICPVIHIEIMANSTEDAITGLVMERYGLSHNELQFSCAYGINQSYYLLLSI